MDDSSTETISYPGYLERVAQDKCARTLIRCYALKAATEYFNLEK